VNSFPNLFSNSSFLPYTTTSPYSEGMLLNLNLNAEYAVKTEFAGTSLSISSIDLFKYVL